MIYNLEVDVNPIMHFNAKFWDLTLIVILSSIHQDQCSIDYSVDKQQKQTNKQTNKNNKTKQQQQKQQNKKKKQKQTNKELWNSRFHVQWCKQLKIFMSSYSHHEAIYQFIGS